MALDNGWFKMQRSLLRSHIWQKSTSNQCKVLITILSMVNFEQKGTEFNGFPIVLEPGQVITSLQEIADKCGKGIDLNHVRSALKRFQKLGFITVKSTKRGSLITVYNFDTYNSIVFKKHKANSVSNSDEAQANHKSDTPNKNLKKERIEKVEKEAPLELQIEQMLNHFYYQEASNHLEALIHETAFRGDPLDLPGIIKKFSCYAATLESTILSLSRLRPAFKLWLMRERSFSGKSNMQNNPSTINFSKVLKNK